MKLGLKCSIDEKQLLDRLEKNPDIIEIHLNEDDLFGNNKKRLIYIIELIQSKNIKVYLHQPMKINGMCLNIIAKEPIRQHYLELTTIILKEICLKYNIKCVIHMNYGQTIYDYERKTATVDDYLYLVSQTLQFLNRHDKNREFILIENSCDGIGAYRDDYLLASIISKTDITLCFDVSHAYISLDDKSIEEMNKALFETVEILKDRIEYYHVVDSEGLNSFHDSLELGKGTIDFMKLKSFIVEKDYIYEVGLSNISNCEEMIKSHNYFKNL